MRHPNHRLVKVHRTYTVEEAARCVSVHRNTVREWIKRGLPTCDGRRPTLILGRDLVAFLRARRARNRQRCGPGEIYCVRCRMPTAPAEGMAEYRPTTSSLGSLIGICPRCHTLMYRRVSLARLAQVRGALEVTLPQGLRDISESPSPFVNCDFGQGRRDHDNAQRP